MFFTPLFLAALLSLAAAWTSKSVFWPDEDYPICTNCGLVTMEDFTRTCSETDDNCLYTFNIVTPANRTPCEYTVHMRNASRESAIGPRCDKYAVASRWSDKYGPGRGYMTLGVHTNDFIIWPTYAEKQFVNGQPIKPDQSYRPHLRPKSELQGSSH